MFSADHLQQYQRDGFVVVKGMFTPEEMDVASDAFASDPDFQPDGPNQISLNNEENGETLLYLWSNPTGTMRVKNWIPHFGENHHFFVSVS